MAVIGLKQTAWNNASAAQKEVARMVFNRLELGAPVSGTIGSDDWFVWSDTRIDTTFVENLGWCLANLAGFTDSPVRNYVVDEGDDPLEKAAEANLGANWFTARSSLPSGWVPDTAAEGE